MLSTIIVNLRALEHLLKSINKKRYSVIYYNSIIAYQELVKGVEKRHIDSIYGGNMRPPSPVITYILVVLAYSIFILFFTIANLLNLGDYIVKKALLTFTSSKHKRKLVRAPGTTALKVIKFLFSKKAVDVVFAQLIADMREEHSEAMAMKSFKKARWIVLRDHANLILTVAVYLAVSVGKKLVKIWKFIP